jgi:hypothetical protein
VFEVMLWSDRQVLNVFFEAIISRHKEGAESVTHVHDNSL